MSDLAPFVAAALRDRTVIALMEENQKKDQLIDEFMRVQVTGPNGTPVYADGQFNKGKYRDIHEWTSSFHHKLDCPLAELRGVEVRLGGVVQFTLDPTRDQTVRLRMFGMQFQHGGRVLKILADDGTNVSVVIDGRQEREWKAILRNGDVMNADVSFLDYFDSMPDIHNCFVRFRAISFNVEKYEAMIRRVPLSKEAREEQMAKHAFQQALDARLGEPLVPREIPTMASYSS